jgi:gas vesicle protein
MSSEGEKKMIHTNQEYEYPGNSTLGVLSGIVLGGLAGAATMLLLAPQSGKVTRKQIQEKGSELLRHWTSELVEDTAAPVGTKANKLAEGVGLKDRSQELALEQSRRESGAGQAGKKAVQDS